MNSHKLKLMDVKLSRKNLTEQWSLFFKRGFRSLLNLALFSSLVLLSACGYRLGLSSRALPQNHREVAVPVFENRSSEVGIEQAFTNAMISQIERSSAARVVPESQAPVILHGVIESIEYLPGNKTEGAGLPTGAVLAAEYRVLATVKIRLERTRVIQAQPIWERKFSSEITYTAPQVTQGGLNTVNPLYNLSARRIKISELADTLMLQAFDRLTDNF